MSSERGIRKLLADYDERLMGDNSAFMQRHRGIILPAISDVDSEWGALATLNGLFDDEDVLEATREPIVEVVPA